MAKYYVDVNKRGRDWEVVTFSDPNTVNGLLRNRWRFDLLFEREDTNVYESNCDLADFDENIICTYADLDNLIEKANFNERQYKIIKMYSAGYIEEDIAEELDVTEQAIVDALETICQKITDINYEQWKSWAYWNVVPVKTDYKQCGKCKKWLPMTEEYYYKEPLGKDGFKSVCIKCIK